MAKSRAVPPTNGAPEVTPEVGKRLLNQLLARGRALLGSPPLTANANDQWQLLARDYLSKAFGANTENVNSVTHMQSYQGLFDDASESEMVAGRAENLQSQLLKLETLLEILETHAELEAKQPFPHSAPITGINRRRLFLVHGTDDSALQKVARFLEHLQLDVIVLKEKPNEGQTVMEKFEANSDVHFAVVLLTADDIGGPTGTPPKNLNSRARQNVIFELGYFIGKLGRKNVCALRAPGVEILSDFAGVVYIALAPDDTWKVLLARELKAAKIEFDMNLAIA